MEQIQLQLLQQVLQQPLHLPYLLQLVLQLQLQLQLPVLFNKYVLTWLHHYLNRMVVMLLVLSNVSTEHVQLTQMDVFQLLYQQLVLQVPQSDVQMDRAKQAHPNVPLLIHVLWLSQCDVLTVYVQHSQLHLIQLCNHNHVLSNQHVVKVTSYVLMDHVNQPHHYVHHQTYVQHP
jgi:hypothetical protein